MRLFYALPLSEEIRNALCGTMDALRPLLSSGRFPLPQNLHLTLAFLGETPPERLPAAKEALEAAAGGPFPLRIGGLGLFRRSGGDILWAGVERTPELLNFQKALCRELAARGFRLEAREFRPHLTLARQAAFREAEKLLPQIPAMAMTAETAVLFRSDRTDAGMKYTPVFIKHLK